MKPPPFFRLTSRESENQVDGFASDHLCSTRTQPPFSTVGHVPFLEPLIPDAITVRINLLLTRPLRFLFLEEVADR